MSAGMYGDTAVIRRRVGQLREQAGELRALGDTLVAQSEGLDWSGRAADAMRDRVRDRAAHLRDAAHRHEDAAEALERHLVAVDRAKEQIAHTEHRFAGLVSEARTRVAAAEATASEPGVRVEADPADLALVGFQPPAAGHRDWLDVQLPGESSDQEA